MADQGQDFSELPDLDLGYDEGEAQDPGYDPTVERVREALGIPHIEAIREDLMAAEANQLADEFQELREQENAQQLIEATSEVAARLGVSEQDPRYWELARLVHGAGTNPRTAARVDIQTGQDFLEHISGRDQGKGAGALPF